MLTFAIHLMLMSFWKRNKTPKPKATEITAENFKELVMQTDKPVLLDFWAAWCAPCKVMGPIIDELSKEFEGQAVVGKINTEQQPKLAGSFQIRSIPTLVIMKNGNVVERFSGIIPKPNLAEMLNDYKD